MAKKTKADSAPSTQPASDNTSSVTPAIRDQWVAEAAYYYAERRGFQGGDPTSDWFQAERDIAQQFNQQQTQ